MIIKKQFRGIAIFTLFIFTCFTLTLDYSFSQEEDQLLKAKEIYQNGNSTEAGAATMEKAKSDAAQTSVQEKPALQLKKKKKFPFLLAILSVGIVAGMIVLIAKKIKTSAPEVKYTLTVTKGRGVAGTPESGIYTYSEGSAIQYHYSPQSGYKDLVVKLDGATVAASGSIAMNGDHTLEIPSLPFSVQPVPWNGHYYLVIEENIDWATARERAVKAYYNGNYGYLVTLTSQAENNFVASLIGEKRAWLGGHQPVPQPDPNAGWFWVTGEIWSYTDWAAGEPNGIEESEYALSFVGGGYGLWNDREKVEQLPNFVVEFN